LTQKWGVVSYSDIHVGMFRVLVERRAMMHERS
jgi:hypothetical protein